MDTQQQLRKCWELFQDGDKKAFFPVVQDINNTLFKAEAAYVSPNRSLRESNLSCEVWLLQARSHQLWGNTREVNTALSKAAHYTIDGELLKTDAVHVFATAAHGADIYLEQGKNEKAYRTAIHGLEYIKLSKQSTLVPNLEETKALQVLEGSLLMTKAISATELGRTKEAEEAFGQMNQIASKMNHETSAFGLEFGPNSLGFTKMKVASIQNKPKEVLLISKNNVKYKNLSARMQAKFYFTLASAHTALGNDVAGKVFSNYASDIVHGHINVAEQHAV